MAHACHSSPCRDPRPRRLAASCSRCRRRGASACRRGRRSSSSDRGAPCTRARRARRRRRARRSTPELRLWRLDRRSPRRASRRCERATRSSSRSRSATTRVAATHRRRPTRSPGGRVVARADRGRRAHAARARASRSRSSTRASTCRTPSSPAAPNTETLNPQEPAPVGGEHGTWSPRSSARPPTASGVVGDLPAGRPAVVGRRARATARASSRPRSSAGHPRRGAARDGA